MIGFGLVSHWLKKWREFFNQSQSAVKQDQSNYQIIFDTQCGARLGACINKCKHTEAEVS